MDAVVVLAYRHLRMKQMGGQSVNASKLRVVLDMSDTSVTMGMTTMKLNSIHWIRTSMGTPSWGSHAFQILHGPG